MRYLHNIRIHVPLGFIQIASYVIINSINQWKNTKDDDDQCFKN